MSRFRIIQSQPLTHVLPFEVEECHRVWFLLWPVWRALQERTFTGRRFLTAPHRFQTTQDAQVFIEHLLALRASREAERVRLLDEQRQLRQLRRMPRVVWVVSSPLPA